MSATGQEVEVPHEYVKPATDGEMNKGESSVGQASVSPQKKDGSAEAAPAKPVSPFSFGSSSPKKEDDAKTVAAVGPKATTQSPFSFGSSSPKKEGTPAASASPAVASPSFSAGGFGAAGSFGAAIPDAASPGAGAFSLATEASVTSPAKAEAMNFSTKAAPFSFGGKPVAVVASDSPAAASPAAASPSFPTATAATGFGAAASGFGAASPSVPAATAATGFGAAAAGFGAASPEAGAAGFGAASPSYDDDDEDEDDGVEDTKTYCFCHALDDGR